MARYSNYDVSRIADNFGDYSSDDEPEYQRPQETANNNNNELPSCSSSKKNTNLQPGNAYIFNHYTFHHSKLEDRKGSSTDVENLLKVFKKFKLKYELFEDATVKKIKETVEEIVKKDFSSISCVVIVILSHGNRHEKVGALNDMFNINDDILFPILGNSSLSDKPKIMFIQACKGNRTVGGLEPDSVPQIGPPSEIFKCFSTFEGYVSFRHTETGSIFIRTLCKVLEEHGATEHIANIMEMVTLQVKEETKKLSEKLKENFQQIPSTTTTLTKKYIFGDYVN